MDYESTMRNAVIAYSRVPAEDLDRTEARMSASTGAVLWERMCLWMDGEPETLKWDASKLDNAYIFGLRVRRDDSVPDGEVQYWTRR